MHALIHVSNRTLPALSGSADIDAIVAAARPRNAALGVTGALVATPTYFAQLLEGTERALAELMESIWRDPRHSGVVTTHLTPKPHRDLPRWSLAYHGESDYVADMLERAISAHEKDRLSHAEEIRALVQMFA